MVILIANINIAFAAPVSDRPWDEYISGTDLRDRAVSSAEAAILVDANSGRILFEKRSTSRNAACIYYKDYDCYFGYRKRQYERYCNHKQ